MCRVPLASEVGQWERRLTSHVRASVVRSAHEQTDPFASMSSRPPALADCAGQCHTTESLWAKTFLPRTVDRRMPSTVAPQSARPAASSAAATSPQPSIAWYRTTFGWAMAGSVLMYAALPPWDLWPLAWIAPVPWLMLARRSELFGRRPYRAIWLAGFLFWLGVLHWLRLPHWATSFGWVALSFYLAFYIPLFVA